MTIGLAIRTLSGSRLSLRWTDGLNRTRKSDGERYAYLRCFTNDFSVSFLFLQVKRKKEEEVNLGGLLFCPKK